MSRTGAPVGDDAHAAWFGRSIADPNTRLLIGETPDGKAGMVRIDRGAETEVSINLNPAFRGRGLSLPLLMAALADETGELTAYIRPENRPSLRLFARAGFLRTGDRDGLERWTRPATREAKR